MNEKRKYNPLIHHRRSIRLIGYDYSQAGLYFITICCEGKISRFGTIENHEMLLNEFGNVAFDEWLKLSDRFTNFQLDCFQIMPNHFHGIIVLNDIGIENKDKDCRNEQLDSQDIHHSSIAEIIGAYKSLVANGCLTIAKSQNEQMGKFWQRNYYEHIIRTPESYQTIADYIVNNPHKWIEDKFYV